MPQASQMTALVMEEVNRQISVYHREIGQALADAANRANPHPECGRIFYAHDGLHVPLVAHIVSEGASPRRLNQAMHRTNRQGQAVLRRVQNTPRLQSTQFLRRALHEVVRSWSTILR